MMADASARRFSRARARHDSYDAVGRSLRDLRPSTVLLARQLKDPTCSETEERRWELVEAAES
jgi:hypothetical protein